MNNYTLVFGPIPNMTPTQSALGVRNIFSGKFPTTWPEYFADTPPELTALAAECAVIAQTGCTGDEAEEAVAQVLPELYADYWNNLPYFPTSGKENDNAANLG